MAKKRSRKLKSEELEINMTPMIDIVFQLLIFFVMTMNFVETEGELRSYLPKNRGQQPTSASSIDLANVTIYLDWKGDNQTGYCNAITTKYQPESGGSQDQYEFPTVPGKSSYPTNKDVNYDCPHFTEIENYIRYRHDSYSGVGFALPVTVNLV